MARECLSRWDIERMDRKRRDREHREAVEERDHYKHMLDIAIDHLDKGECPPPWKLSPSSGCPRTKTGLCIYGSSERPTHECWLDYLPKEAGGHEG